MWKGKKKKGKEGRKKETGKCSPAYKPICTIIVELKGMSQLSLMGGSECTNGCGMSVTYWTGPLTDCAGSDPWQHRKLAVDLQQQLQDFLLKSKYSNIQNGKKKKDKVKSA